MNRRSCPAGVLPVLIVLLWASAPDPAFAQASRLGNTFGVFPGATGAVSPVRFPAVAYDTKSDVFLTCTGLGLISCAFVGSDGVPRTNRFGINDVFAYNAAPGIAYSADADAFLVSWVDTRTFNSQGTVWGRLVSYNGGSPAIRSPEFEISRATAPGGGANGEARIGVAYSTVSQEFIAVWTQLGVSGSGRYDIRGRRINTAGQLIGAEIPVTMNGQWEQRPSVAYNPDDNEFAIAYEFAPNTAAIRVQRVQAGTGALLGGFTTVIEAAWTSVPDIEYNTASKEYFVGWYQDGGIRGIQGARLGRTGSLIGGTFPVALGYASNDAFGVDFNPVANAYFTIFHGLGVEDVGNEVSNLGIPGAPFTVTNIAGGNGAFNPKIAASTKTAEWLVVTSRSQSQIVGQRVQTASRNGGTPPPPPPPSPTAIITLSADAAPNGSWFFAEGATGSSALGFDTYYLIANEGDTQAEVRAFIAREDGFAYERTFDIAPRSRHTMRLAQHVESGSYSVVIQSLSANEPIWAERAMYWGTNFEGGSAAGGVRALSKQWLFAEGSTKNNFFDNFYLLFNPGGTDANVNVTYFLPDGQTPVVRTYSIPKQGRLTIHANAIPQLANTDFSVQVDADQLIVAERSMYFGTNWAGGTNSSGAPAAATAWFFAEGAAADRFDTYYTLLNPHSSAISVGVVYLREAGALIVKYYEIPAKSRYTISLTAEVGLAGAVSAQIFTPNLEPFVAERSIYWGQPWVEGTSSLGETTLGSSWHLPEGTTKNGFDTYVLIANPNNFPVTARMTQLREDGQIIVTDLAIQPFARRTVYLSDAAQFPSLQNQSFATRIEILTDEAPGVKAGVLVEHAIYWRRDPQNYWRGGSSAFGIR